MKTEENELKKQQEAVKKMTFKEKLIHLWKHAKRPAFIIPTIVTWLLLESPLIVSMIIFFITGDRKFLGIAIFWYGLTAAPLPIPVLPISLAVGTLFERLIFTGKKKRAKFEKIVNEKAEEIVKEKYQDEIDKLADQKIEEMYDEYKKNKD